MKTYQKYLIDINSYLGKIFLNFLGFSFVIKILSCVNGWRNSKVEACKYNPFPFKISPSLKYSLSPKIGFPIASKCFLS